MKNLILNGGYNSKSILFEKGSGDQIYFKGKKRFIYIGPRN